MVSEPLSRPILIRLRSSLTRSSVQYSPCDSVPTRARIPSRRRVAENVASEHAFYLECIAPVWSDIVALREDPAFTRGRSGRVIWFSSAPEGVCRQQPRAHGPSSAPLLEAPQRAASLDVTSQPPNQCLPGVDSTVNVQIARSSRLLGEKFRRVAADVAKPCTAGPRRAKSRPILRPLCECSKASRARSLSAPAEPRAHRLPGDAPAQVVLACCIYPSSTHPCGPCSLGRGHVFDRGENSIMSP